MRRRWWTRQGRTILNEFTGEINEYSDDDDDGGDANEESSAGLPESVAARVGVINLLVLILADPDTVARRGHRREPQAVWALVNLAVQPVHQERIARLGVLGRFWRCR